MAPLSSQRRYWSSVGAQGTDWPIRRAGRRFPTGMTAPYSFGINSQTYYSADINLSLKLSIYLYQFKIILVIEFQNDE